MLPVSDRFADLIWDSHTVATKVEVLQAGAVVADLTELGVVLDGSVQASRSATQRTASLSIVDTDGTLSPSEANELFLPAGNELRLWRGVVFPDATQQEMVDGTDRELVPLGTFRFTNVDGDYPNVAFSQMYDRSWVISGAKLLNTTVIAAGTTVTDAIGTLLQAASPGVETNLPDTDEVVVEMIFEEESDPWDVCQQLAANLGMILYFDPMGVCSMREEPDPLADPIALVLNNEYEFFVENKNMLLGLTQAWEGVSYNAQVVVGENTSLAAPVRAVAYDLDPESPTQWNGNYGRRPAPIIRDEKIASVAQARLRARKELRSQLGLFQKLDLPSLVHPALEIGDILLINYVREQFRLTQLAIVDSLTIPMRATQSMQIETRSRQVTNVDDS